MNFTDVLKALSSASAFELYRMRAAIDRVLDEPRWMLAVQSRLRVGQSVEYFDPQTNALRHGQVKIGVGNGDHRPLPPNPVCGSPATGFPVSCFHIGIGAPIDRLQTS